MIIICKFLSPPWCLLFAKEIRRLFQFLNIFEPCKKCLKISCESFFLSFNVFNEHPPVSVYVVELAEVGLFETCALSICSHRFICDVIIKDFRGNFCEIHD